MKYTTRIALALSIVVASVGSVIIHKSSYLFFLTVYPLVTGWIIGECINIPERKIRKKWQCFKNRIIIRLINLIDYLTENGEK
ncbi:hypothetical protein [Candidatus Enterococcus clewellii]|uniref:Uncharacterized protein n=1 Tax=Candidatus Enterococcus clewellii TaxID=1834193 RepID=A0A242K3Z3_9ENTE|nr:hypothetical protein [Enterococcus sp. 9E7_DIV0242]OTP12687.1 hypothetical protein A5888_003265 [Enterococcus sp. 9E7_DIV0242]